MAPPVPTSCGNNCMSLLTSHLLVTGGQGHIQLIDLDRGEISRTVSVGSLDKSAFDIPTGGSTQFFPFDEASKADILTVIIIREIALRKFPH